MNIIKKYIEEVPISRMLLPKEHKDSVYDSYRDIWIESDEAFKERVIIILNKHTN